MSVIHHPVAQITAAGLVAATLPTNVGMVAGAVATIYYAILILDYVRNWKPAAAPAGTVQTAFARLAAIWREDKPYIAALAIAGYAAAQYFHYQLPPWAETLGVALGVTTFHSYLKGNLKP